MAPLLLALLLLTAAPAAAQQGSLELQIVDGAGKKVTAATVTVEDAAGTAVKSGAPNKKGVFEANLPNPGQYTVKISSPGWADYAGTIEIQASMTTATKVTLIDQATRNRQLAVETFNAGVAALQEKQDEAALAKFFEASKLDPNLQDAPRVAALLAASINKLDVAKEALEHYLSLNPAGLADVAEAAYRVDRSLGRKDRLAETRAVLQSVGRANDVAIAVFNEGVVAVKAEKISEARALFGEALELDPKLLQAHRSLAALDFNDKKYEEALPHIKQLLELSPRHREGRRLLFFALNFLSRDQEANEAAKQWLEVDTGAASEIIAQANARFEANDAAKAKSLLEAVLAADPNNAFAEYNLGRTLASLGYIADAKTHLKRFLELDPNHPEAASAKAMLSGL